MSRVDKESVNKAKRALKVFRTLQPTLSAYARMLTGRPNIKVVAAAHDNGSTDGRNIYYRPPIALGETTPHLRSKCDKRDDRGIQMCTACDTREDVLATIYHEIAHIWFGSFAATSEEDKRSLLSEGIDECKGRYAKAVRARVAAAFEYQKDEYMKLAGLISPFLPILLNALEDARVNRELFRALPGTKAMFDAHCSKAFEDGVEQQDPETGEWKKILWKEYKLNLQALVGVFCKASGYKYDTWFTERVVRDLNDEKLTALVAKCDLVSSMAEVYRLSFPILARLRELGYCRLEEDPEAEESSEDGEEEPRSEPGKESNEDSDKSEDDEDTPSIPDDKPDPGGDSGTGSDKPGETERESSDEGEGTSSGSSDDTGEVSDDKPGEREDATAEDAGSGTDSSGSSDGEVSGGSGGAGDLDPETEAPGGHGPAPECDGEGAEADDAEEDGKVDGEDVPTSEGREGDDGVSPDDSGSHFEGDDLDSPREEAGEDSPPDREGSLEEDDTGSPPDSTGTTGADERSPDDHSDGDGDRGESEGLDPTESGSSGDPSPVGDEVSLGGTGGTEASPDDEGDDDGLIDTGTYTRGTRVIEIESDEEDVPEEDPLPPPEEMGTPEECKIGILKLGDHEEPPTEVHAHVHHGDSEEAVEAMDLVILQDVYFEMPSADVSGITVFTFPEDLHGTRPAPSRRTDTGPAWNYRVWARHGESLGRLGVLGDFSAPESVLQPALMQARIAFADNARAKFTPNLKAGRVNPRVLGKRAPVQDPRLMRKKTRPGKKSFFVLIGIDVSGSSMGINIDLAKRVAMAEAELCSRMGLDFAVYAHSGGHSVGEAAYRLHMYQVKADNEPWNDKTRERLSRLGPDAANLDGHTMEFYRKILDRRPEQTKILHYYTDGAMPLENFDEELEILGREIKTCKNRGYTVLGVGIRTDAPKQHGLETIEVNEQADILAVVKHLEKRIVG